MEIVTTPSATVVDIQNSGVSWPAIAAGAIGAAALSLVLASLGAGLGLSVISPWPDSGVSTTTFKVGAGIYLCCTAVMASAVGGYLAARLRTKWIGIHTNEVFFRDTAHGFLAWGFATVLLASVLGAATSHIWAVCWRVLRPVRRRKTIIQRRYSSTGCSVSMGARRRQPEANLPQANKRLPVRRSTPHGWRFSGFGRQAFVIAAILALMIAPMLPGSSQRAPA